MQTPIPLAKPALDDLEKKYVLEALASGIIAQGPFTERLEKSFAELCGVKHAIAVSSGTAALHLSLLAHGIGPGDEVITTGFSFMATVSSILFAGARPVFVDIDEETYNIDPKLIEAAITPKTKAILPIHLYGHPCAMDAIMDIARRHKLIVIEDAAQAVGALFQGKPVGSFGTGCFSLYATKNVTSGEGGIITTDDDGIADRCRLLRSHGMRKRYEHEILGYNMRLNDLCSAVGVAQMEKRSAMQKRRAANAEFLTAHLRTVPVPVVRPGCTHVWHQYTIRTGNRAAVIEALTAQGIGTAVFYAKPLYVQPSLKPFLDRLPSMPVTERVCAEVLQLPVHPLLTPEELERIVAAVNSL